jgi:hypothetical protein
VWSLLFWWR